MINIFAGILEVNFEMSSVYFSWNGKNNSWIITDALRPTIVNLDFQRKGKTVFKSVNFAGHIGMLTGMKPVSYFKCMILPPFKFSHFYETAEIFVSFNS